MHAPGVPCVLGAVDRYYSTGKLYVRIIGNDASDSIRLGLHVAIDMSYVMRLCTAVRAC